MGVFRRYLRVSKLLKDQRGNIRVFVRDCRTNFVVLSRHGVQGRRQYVSYVVRWHRATGDLLRGTPLVGRVVGLLKAFVLVGVRR